MPALFFPPEDAYQSVQDPELSYTFLRRWHPMGPDLASSSKDVLPRLNSPTQNLT